MPMPRDDLLHPLTAASFVRDFPWRHPLKYVATRFTQPSVQQRVRPGVAKVSLMFITGVGCTSHLYIPVARNLFRLSHAPGSRVHVLSVWVVDRPNHGEAAVLNADVLDREYSKFFPYAAYGRAIAELIDSGLLSPDERNSLVGVGHSGGCGALMEAFPRGAPCPFKSIILIEGPVCENTPETTAVFRMVQKVVAASNAKMPQSWPSVDAAMAYFAQRLPWSSFDKENLKIMAATFFAPVVGGNGTVTTVTSAAQRTAAFSDIETCYDTTARVSTMLRDIPVTAIMGSVQDLWPAPMSEAIAEKIDRMQQDGLVVLTVEGAGHHVPHEKPDATAHALMEALARLAPTQSKL